MIPIHEIGVRSDVAGAGRQGCRVAVVKCGWRVLVEIIVGISGSSVTIYDCVPDLTAISESSSIRYIAVNGVAGHRAALQRAAAEEIDAAAGRPVGATVVGMSVVTAEEAISNKAASVPRHVHSAAGGVPMSIGSVAADRAVKN